MSEPFRTSTASTSSRRTARSDRELEEFRQLIEPATSFDEGFTWPAFFGALFVALLMVPGAMYMSLIAGGGHGITQAAQWVTVILFIEVARRANQVLKRAEIFTLFYLAGAAIGTPFAGVLWQQFYAQSDAARAAGITEWLPHWYAPRDADVLSARSLLQWEWLPAIALVVFSTFLTRIDNMILGYGLFRVASDIERLPFPMAPIGAQGVLALSDEQEEERVSHDINAEPMKPTSWRWRVFAVGGVLGLVFGVLYLGLPTITGALVGSPVVILPIPFVDWTQKTSGLLPAVAMNLSFDATNILFGMVLPFYSMLGSFIGLVINIVANPILYKTGILTQWNPADGAVVTVFKNYVDFFFSFQIGLSLAVAGTGIVAIVKGLSGLRRRRKQLAAESEAAVRRRAERGDIPMPFVLGTYLVSVTLYILVSGWLIDWHRGVMLVMLFYGFLYTPLVSYATARLEGIAGQVVVIPMIREASFILSGYRGVAVWFLPTPLHNYGSMTVFYRQCELTGTKFRSIWKSELLLAPIILCSGLLFAHFIWRLAPIPGPQYPYAQVMWELNAENAAIIHSSTLGGYSRFEEALNWRYLASGFGIGTAAFALMNWLGWPVFLMYGIVRGLGNIEPQNLLPQFIGALIGRFYFQRRLGLKWRQYIPVVAAGFMCGMGLVGTLGIGFTFLVKSVFQLPF